MIHADVNISLSCLKEVNAMNKSEVFQCREMFAVNSGKHHVLCVCVDSKSVRWVVASTAEWLGGPCGTDASLRRRTSTKLSTLQSGTSEWWRHSPGFCMLLQLCLCLCRYQIKWNLFSHNSNNTVENKMTKLLNSTQLNSTQLNSTTTLKKREWFNKRKEA